MKYVLACVLAVLLLGGCSVDDAIGRAERAAHAATMARADVQNAIDHADAIAVQLKALAAGLDSERAKQVVAQADALVAAAKAALPQADAALAAANDAVTVAKKAREDGGNWFNVLAAVVGTVIPAVGVGLKVISNLRNAVSLRDTAIIATAEHADRMENAASDLDMNTAKLVSIAQQKAAGVADLIESLRTRAPKGG